MEAKGAGAWKPAKTAQAPGVRRRCAPTPPSRPARRAARSAKCRKAACMFKALSARSIASRLFLSAAFWSTLILALAGLGLSALNERWTEANFDDQLGVYLKALVANVAIPNDETKARRPGRHRAAVRARLLGLVLADHPHRRESAGNPRLEVAVRDPIAASAPRSRTHGAILSGYVVGPGGHELRMIEREIDAGDEGRYLVQVAANADVIQGQERSFEWALAATFLTLALALIGSTALAVRFGLQAAPGTAGRGGRHPPRARPNASPASFPRTSRRWRPKSISSSTPTGEIVERARTQVGNLAHALKTPLSVLMNEADAMSPTLSEKVREQAEIMRRQVTFYLDRARAAARARTFGVGDRGEAGRRGARSHLREAARRAGAYVRRRFAARPQVPRRSAGSHRSDRQPARQCGKMGARAGLDSRRRARSAATKTSLPFSSPRSTTTARASTKARAPRRSSAASGSTSRGPAPASACRSSSISPRSTAARSRSTKARSEACAQS